MRLLFVMAMVTLWTGCSVTQPVPAPCPTCPPATVVHDTVLTVKTFNTTIYRIVTDSMVIDQGDTVIIGDHVDVRWFGLYQDGVHDDQPAFQAASDFIIRHYSAVPNKLSVPVGDFWFFHTWLLYDWVPVSGQYAFFTIRVNGQSTMASSYGSVIHKMFRNGPAIAIQQMKGGCIDGLTILGQLHPIVYSAYQFYSNPALSFADTSFRNQYHSPDCGIAIDVACPAANAPFDMYPGLEFMYRGYGIQGSTGVEIKNNNILGHVVDIISSPNGFTKNDELLDIEHDQIGDAIVGIAGTQAEEKANLIYDIMCWGTVQTLFSTGQYGAGAIGNWNVDLVNAAGYVFQLVDNVQQGYFPSNFNRIYAEMLGRIGTISSGNGTSFSNSSINFANPIDGAMQFMYAQIQGSGVRYENDQFRMYGTDWPVNINNLNGYNQFINCGWETEPYWNTDYGGSGQEKFEDNYINQFPMDSIKGTLTAADSTAPGQYPIYQVNDTLVGGHYQARIMCVGNELERVKTGTSIVAYDHLSVTQGVIGVVISTDSVSFTIGYLSSQIISGQKYYLCIYN